MSIEAMKRALEDIAAYYPNSWAADRAKAAIQQAEAQQPAAGEPVDFIVSAVLIKKTPDGLFSTQNKLYAVEAASREEAHGKVLPLLGVDFPEHQLHTFCSRPVPSVPADMVRNAERYEWLRKADRWPCVFPDYFDPEPLAGSELDECVDAAMLAAKDSK